MSFKMAWDMVEAQLWCRICAIHFGVEEPLMEELVWGYIWQRWKRTHEITRSLFELFDGLAMGQNTSDVFSTESAVAPGICACTIGFKSMPSFCYRPAGSS